MKKFLSVLFVAGLASCTQTNTVELTRKVTIEGSEYAVSAHVYFTPTDAERRADIHFYQDDWQTPCFPIDQITDYNEVIFFIDGVPIEKNFTSVTLQPNIFEGHIANLPVWKEGTPVDVFFSFTYNGNRYKLKYSTNICNHW